MKSMVYLIGQRSQYIHEIEKALASEYHFKQVLRADLMGEIFKRIPQCIIIVEDDMDRDGFLMVDSTISFEFIPIICVSFTREVWQIEKHISYASYLNVKEIHVLLPALVQQATFFWQKYHDVQVTQDTYDIMNEGIRESTVKYVETDAKLDQTILMAYLKSVYVDNYFVENRPMTMWLLKDEGSNKFKAHRFSVACDSPYIELEFQDDYFDFAPFKETGFFKNTSIDELSDIEDVRQLLPEKVKEASGTINNGAIYATDQIMLMAMNYTTLICQRDLNILKALTINLDLMIAVKDKVIALEDSFVYTMNALARAAEGKDDVTGQHIKRVNYYSRNIATAMMLPPKFVKNIAVAAQMHDVGKIFIPEELLNKSDKLSDEEFELIKTHTIQGQVIIGDSDNLQMAARIARHHHEKYDGSGYPDGLVGEAIPLEARIVSLADIYDALRSERPYKKGFSHEESFKIITEGDGRVEPHHFDPTILEIFKERHQVFNEIFIRLKD